MPIGISERLRKQVSQADRNRCAYCQTGEANCGIPLTIDHIQPGEIVPLFNPRAQSWSEHFRWSANATRVEGLTAIGRATIIALRMNREAILAIRARWVWGGWNRQLIDEALWCIPP